MRTWDGVEAAKEHGATGRYTDAYPRRLLSGLNGSGVPRRLVVTLLSEVP